MKWDDDKPYVVWVDYGTEGWSPLYQCATFAEALATVCGGVSGPWAIHKKVVVDEVEEP